VVSPMNIHAPAGSCVLLLLLPPLLPLLLLPF
jgi:hypothetical protein